MAWYNASWLYRKKLTVTAASVIGTGTLTGVPVFFDPSADSDIAARARTDGKDLVFTSSDGTTELPYTRLPRKQYLTRDGNRIWFVRRVAVYHHGANERLYAGVQTRGAGALPTILQYDYDTGVITSFAVGASASFDDHNNCAVLVRSSDAKVLVFYTNHGGDDLHCRISTNAEDISAWGTEQDLDPNSTHNYSYSQVVELTGEGRIYWFYRLGLADQWWYIYSEDDGATWEAATQFNTGTGFGTNPYPIITTNGTRIDVLMSSGSPNQAESYQVGHCYYDGSGTWRQTDGTSMGAPPFDFADLTEIFDGGASDKCWVGDITYKGDGHPHVLFNVYPAGDEDDHDLYYSAWSGSAWSAPVKVCDEGGAWVIDATSAVYPGCSVLDPDDDTIAWVSIERSGIREIEKWKNTGGVWAIVSGPDGTVTSGSAYHCVRPVVALNCPAGKEGRLLFLAGYYEGFGNYSTGMIGFPAFGSNYGITYFKATLDGNADNIFYCYYGNASATDQQDTANVWSTYTRVYHTAEKYGDAPGYYRDASGNGTAIDRYRIAEYAGPDDNIGPAAQFVGSESINLGTTVNYAGWTASTTEIWARSDLSGGNEHTLFGHFLAGTKAEVCIRLETAGGGGAAVEGFITLEANSFIAGNPVSGLTPVADSWKYYGLNWTPAGGLMIRQDKTEGTPVSSGGGTAIDATASPTLYLGADGASGADFLVGGLAEFRVSTNVARSKDQTDTQWDNWDQGNAFFTIGNEERQGRLPGIRRPWRVWRRAC